jgi:chloride channel 3/4/5
MSVAFGAPIGGVLFSLEQVSYYFPDKVMWHAFVCAMIAAVSLQAMNPFRTGKLVLWQVTYDRNWHDFEILSFVVLGCLGGVYGAAFLRMNMKAAFWRKYSWVRNYPVYEVVVIALLTAIISYPNIFTRLTHPLRGSTRILTFCRVQSTELLAAFKECKDSSSILGLCGKLPTAPTIILLLLAAITGTCFASITFGMQIPAGIILPSMAIGALYGRALGLLVQAWQKTFPGAWMFSSCKVGEECVSPGLYAIAGAASALAGVTRLTGTTLPPTPTTPYCERG